MSIINCYHQNHHHQVLFFERRSHSVAKDDLKLIIFCLSLLSSKMMGTRYKPPRKVVCVLVCVHIHLYMTMYGGQWLMTGSTLILRQAP